MNRTIVAIYISAILFLLLLSFEALRYFDLNHSCAIRYNDPDYTFSFTSVSFAGSKIADIEPLQKVNDLCHGFLQIGSKIYWDGVEIPGANVASFKILTIFSQTYTPGDPIVSRDNSHVYFSGIDATSSSPTVSIPNINPDAVRILGYDSSGTQYPYLTDGKHVFFGPYIVTGAEPGEFIMATGTICGDRYCDAVDRQDYYVFGKKWKSTAL